MENGDGTWSVELPSHVGVADKKVGAVTWRYQAQARYSNERRARSGDVTVDVPAGWEDVSPRGQIIGSRWIDENGAIWKAIDVDLEELARIEAEYISQFPADAPAEELRSLLDEPGLQWRDAQQFDVEPHGWTKKVCPEGASSHTYHLFDDDEDRVTVEPADNDGSGFADTPNVRRQTTVMVMVDVQGDGSEVGWCSGVMLDSNSVLTAAHCVYDGSGNLYPRGDVLVCTMGNAYDGSDCDSLVAVNGFKEPPSNVYGGPYPGSGWHPKKDYIILDMGNGMQTTGEYMFMSAASDSFVESYTMWNLAFPKYTLDPTLSVCLATDDATAVDTTHWMNAARYMVNSGGPIHASANNTWHFSIDGGSQHSGSPIYYCGTALCSGINQPYVVSVWTGWNGFHTTHVGPKVREFRTWALGVL